MHDTGAEDDEVKKEEKKSPKEKLMELRSKHEAA
jgi:hypothetical protein